MNHSTHTLTHDTYVVDPTLCILYMCLTITHGCHTLTNNKKVRFVDDDVYRFLIKTLLLLWFCLNTDAFIYTTILYIASVFEIAYTTLVFVVGGGAIATIAGGCLYKLYIVFKELYSYQDCFSFSVDAQLTA